MPTNVGNKKVATCWEDVSLVTIGLKVAGSPPRLPSRIMPPCPPSSWAIIGTTRRLNSAKTTPNTKYLRKCLILYSLINMKLCNPQPLLCNKQHDKLTVWMLLHTIDTHYWSKSSKVYGRLITTQS